MFRVCCRSRSARCSRRVRRLGATLPFHFPSAWPLGLRHFPRRRRCRTCSVSKAGSISPRRQRTPDRGVDWADPRRERWRKPAFFFVNSRGSTPERMLTVVSRVVGASRRGAGASRRGGGRFGAAAAGCPRGAAAAPREPVSRRETFSGPLSEERTGPGPLPAAKRPRGAGRPKAGVPERSDGTSAGRDEPAAQQRGAFRPAASGQQGVGADPRPEPGTGGRGGKTPAGSPPRRPRRRPEAGRAVLKKRLAPKGARIRGSLNSLFAWATTRRRWLNTCQRRRTWTPAHNSQAGRQDAAAPSSGIVFARGTPPQKRLRCDRGCGPVCKGFWPNRPGPPVLRGGLWA